MVPLPIQLATSTLRKVIKRLHYPLEVMLVCVRWYAAYPLSLRNLEEMMAERGVIVTYIETAEGWLYLAAILDLHSRQVVGWSMQPHMQASLITDALRMAWFRRKPAPGLILHSDRGSQYCSREFQAALNGYACAHR
jgi:transposase InsO family protein